MVSGKELLNALENVSLDSANATTEPLLHPDMTYVHHIWLTKKASSEDGESGVPEKFCGNVASWSTGVPNCVQVEWLNTDAMSLVSKYRKAWFFYKQLKTPVERSDYLRMLILHQFGGVYVDIDMQALKNVVPYLDPTRPINLLRSPLFTEMFQSCFLVSHKKNHPFWMEVATRIEDNVTAISSSKPDGLVGKLMCNPLTRYYTRMAMTVFLTGPATLDKCIANAHVKNMHIDAFSCLPASLYRGPVAVHHEAASWTWLPAFLEAKLKIQNAFKINRFSFFGTLLAMWPTWIVVGAVVAAWWKAGGVY
mgnify:CR=1 FL=1